MVGLVRAGRDADDLAREVEPSAQAIRHGIARADRDGGGREARSEVPTAADGGRRRPSARSSPVRAVGSAKRGWSATSSLARRLGSRAGDRPRDGRGAVGAFRFVSANQALLSMSTMARGLGVSGSGCQAWRRREPSARVKADAAPLRWSRTIHLGSGEAHGAVASMPRWPRGVPGTGASASPG